MSFVESTRVNHAFDWVTHGRHLANTIERSVLGGDAGYRYMEQLVCVQTDVDISQTVMLGYFTDPSWRSAKYCYQLVCPSVYLSSRQTDRQTNKQTVAKTVPSQKLSGQAVNVAEDAGPNFRQRITT